MRVFKQCDEMREQSKQINMLLRLVKGQINVTKMMSPGWTYAREGIYIFYVPFVFFPRLFGGKTKVVVE